MASEAAEVHVRELAEICTDINYGFTASASQLESGPKFLRITDIQGGRLDWEAVPYCEATTKEVERYRLQIGDIVIARTGNSTGENAQIRSEPPIAVFASYLIRFRPDPGLANPMFVGYQLRTERFQEYVHGVRGGSAQPGANAKALGRFPVVLPERQHQDATAVFLNAIEDRIDNLRQTNATLEAIAQALFKSWFVDFDPVRAKAEGREPEGMDAATAALFPSEFEDSELGLIPKGWRVEGLGRSCDNVRKQAKPEALDASTPYIGLEHMSRKSIALSDWDSAQGLASGKFWYQRGDVLFGKLRPYFHKVGIASHEGVCSTDILVIRAKSQAWFGFAAMHLSSDALISYATQLSNGAKMPRTNWHDLAAYKVAMPDENCASAFSELAFPLIARIHHSIDTMRSLAELRDTLLPRLISGKIRLPEVKDLVEHDLAEASA